MNLFKLYLKLIIQILFISIIFNYANAKNSSKFYQGDKISNYFSGILSLNQNDYQDSYKYLKKLNGLEQNHYNYSQNYLFSLVNLEKINEAFRYSKKLELKKIDNFESNLVIGIYYLKNEQPEQAAKYFKKNFKDNMQGSIKEYLSYSLFNWSTFHKINYSKAKTLLSSTDKRFSSIAKIQNVFMHCYYDQVNTGQIFKNLVAEKEIDYSRYNFFYSNYLQVRGEEITAKKIIEKSLDSYPKNLIIKQRKIDLDLKKNLDFENKFNCKNVSNVMAELFYIMANLLSSQAAYSVSNFYLNLAMYLNPDFVSYKTLYAENFYLTENLSESKRIYKKIKNRGSVYNWHSAKQISIILLKEKKSEEALNFLKKNFKLIKNPDTYEIFEYAEFLKNNQKFEESIKLYSKILKIIDKNHKIYHEVTEGRGVAYERSGNWEKAEKDLLNSLSSVPNQAYVINYLAYSWIEKGLKIDQSLKMLEKANSLKKNDGYILDSLGWALFKLNRYEEAKKYLQQAVRLMPSDPIVNDHYGDSLWKMGKKIQARYYWNYVLNLEKTEIELREKVNDKLIFGPKT